MSDVATKWGQAVAERGFAQVPNYLLLLNQFLGDEARLKPAELLLLIQLVGSWWHKDQLPFPSIRTLALRCGVSERQVQRSLLRLEKLGFVKRVSRRTHGIIQSNSYDLSPAASILAKIAEAFPNAFPRKPRKVTKAEEAFFSTVKITPPSLDHLGPPPLVFQASPLAGTNPLALPSSEDGGEEQSAKKKPA